MYNGKVRDWQEIAKLMGYDRERDMFQAFLDQGWAQRKMAWKISVKIYKELGVIDEIPQVTIKYRIDRLKNLGRLRCEYIGNFAKT